jgi:hypothetical protein
MVDIETTHYRYFESIASSIKRLKFEREKSDGYFYNTENRVLVGFENVEEIYVVCAD